MTPEDRFDELIVELTPIDGVSLPAGGRRFGAPALRRDGRIFALLAHGCLVVKLPRARVDALVTAGAGTRFVAGEGRPMKQWLVVADRTGQTWHDLAWEALDCAQRRRLWTAPLPASKEYGCPGR